MNDVIIVIMRGNNNIIAVGIERMDDEVTMPGRASTLDYVA